MSLICICTYLIIIIKNFELLCRAVAYCRSLGLANRWMCIRRVDLTFVFGIFERSISFLEAEVVVPGILHIFSG